MTKVRDALGFFAYSLCGFSIFTGEENELYRTAIRMGFV